MANFEQALDPPRGFNARERRVAALPRYGKILTEVSATFLAGHKAAKLRLRPPRLTLVKFPIE